MSLDTQTFGITRHWLSVGLKRLPRHPDIFSKNQLSFARKEFLAGKNQLQAIRSWLANADVIRTDGREVSLSDRGAQMSTRDDVAQRAWTWWMFHLHLCANKDSFPYCTFFTSFDAEGAGWVTIDDIVDGLTKAAPNAGVNVERSSVESYFEGVDRALRLGSPLYALGLVERRLDVDGGTRVRRRPGKPPHFAVAYATMLFHRRYFPNQPTIEMRMLLQKGLGRSLGVRDSDMREALMHVTQDAGLAKFIQYKHTVNLDSVQFQTLSDQALTKLAAHGYSLGDIRWP